MKTKIVKMLAITVMEQLIKTLQEQVKKIK